MNELDLQDSILRHALELQRLSANEEAEAMRIMAVLETELRQLLASVDLTEAGKREVEALLKNVSQATDAQYAVIGKAIDTNDLVVVVADKTVAALAEVLPSATLPTAQRLASLSKDVLIDGARSSAWWAKQAEDTAFKFAREVRQGVLNGATNEQIASLIFGNREEIGIMETARRNVRSLVHSSIMTASNQSRIETYKANSKHIAGIRWLATLDARTCVICAALDGQEWDIEGNPRKGTTMNYQIPPAHFSCFAGDTPVLARGRITGASKRWFDGEAVVIKTSSGRKLTCTPNHPILTDRGWVAAGLLNVGSNVVCESGGNRFSACDGDGKNAPALIHDVAEAVLASAPMGAVPMIPTSPDFHGDGAGSEVAIVWSDSLLPNSDNSTADKHLDEFGFVRGRLTGLVSFTGCGHSTQGGFGLDVPSVVGMSLGNLFLALGGRHLAPLKNLSFATSPLRNPMIPQNTRYDHSFQVEFLGDSILGNTVDVVTTNGQLVNDGARPGWYAAMLQFAHDDGVRDPSLAADLSGIQASEIEIDAVVQCRRIRFSDHVYNLETDNGWYLAQGIVSHNCRCVASPIPKSLNEILGRSGIDEQLAATRTRASSDGPTTATTFDEFLKRQSPEFVEETLGARRAQLYKQGKITLRDLVSGSGRPLTLDEIRI